MVLVAGKYIITECLQLMSFKSMRKTPPAVSVSCSMQEHTKIMRIGIFIFALTWGGATRRIITLSEAFRKRGHYVKFIVVERDGHLAGMIPGTEVIELRPGFKKLLFPFVSKKRKIELCDTALAKFLKDAECQHQVDILLSAANHVNITAISAKLLSATTIPVVLRISNHLSASLQGQKSRKKEKRFKKACCRYPRADGFIAVSKNIAEDTSEALNIPPKRIKVIYNPTFTPELLSRANETVQHPWLRKRPNDPPVILGAGRLVPQKNFDLLIKAFKIALQNRALRLIILGEGKDRPKLEALVSALGMEDRVDLPGFVENPLAYMARADIFCLSSRFEGLPGVLIEAIATGCPVVSTESPGGTSEILDNGRYGLLVPVEDEQALSDAMLKALDTEWNSEELKRRAATFSVDRAAEEYLNLFERILKQKHL